MPRPLVLVLASLLAGSVAANIYQSRHAPTAAPTTTPTSTAAANAATPVTTETTTDVPAAAAAATTAKRPDGAPPPLAKTCEGQLADLGAKLATAEAKLEDRLTFEEKFDRSPPSPEAEAKLTPLVAKVFEKAPDGYSFEVVCRGEICDVTVTAPERGEDFDWGMKLQQDVYHSEGRGHAMYGGKPTHDPVTKAALIVSRTLVHLNGADTADGMPVLQAIVEQLEASGAAQRCATDGTRSYLSLQLWLDGDAGKITYEVGGTAASTANGQCVLRALDGVIAAAPVPPRSRGAVLYHTLELPP